MGGRVCDPRKLFPRTPLGLELTMGVPEFAPEVVAKLLACSPDIDEKA
jgi:hypothetical protein